MLTFVLILVAGKGSTFDDNTLDWVGEPAGLVALAGTGGLRGGRLGPVGLLVGVGIFGKGRLQVLRDMLLAAAFAVVLVLALTGIIDERWPEFVFFHLDQTRTTFPAFFVTTSAAIRLLRPRG